MVAKRTSMRSKKTFSARKRSKTQKSLVKAVKAVINKNVIERHFRDVHISYVTLTGGSYYGCNPLYFIPQDDTFTGRTGAKIQNARITFKCCYNFNGVRFGGGSGGSNGFPWAKGYLRFLVFKHNKEWRNNNEGFLDDITVGGTGTNLTSGEMVLQSSNERIAHQFLNLKEISVLYDKTVSCSFTSPHVTDGNPATAMNTPYQAGTGYHEFSVKVGDVQYQGGSGLSLTKGKQLYFVAIPSALNPNPTIADDLFGLIMDYGISFGDA